MLPPLLTAMVVALAASFTFGRSLTVLEVENSYLTTTITLDAGTFQGKNARGVSRFLGIPYALPPTGSRRFALPQANEPYTGTHDATEFGPSCPGHSSSHDLVEGLSDALDLLKGAVIEENTSATEDCLSVNVVKPSSAMSSSKLPVVVWIYGGGFSRGQSSSYDGGRVVSRSITLRAPVVYVSMNYRVTAFGFLGGKEVKAAGVGNLGLQDQRLALRWVQKYITAFGGDPTKVTIWGESAGAVSVGMQMVTNGGNTEGLFRAAFMQSGSPISVGDITKGQPYYDALVQKTGCAGTADTLDCLRGVPYQTLQDAINEQPGVLSYQALNLAFGPRTDGVFITDVPSKLVQQGSVANIPFVTGVCDDEGTIFALSTTNITTTAELRTYFHDNYMPAASYSEVDPVLAAYPSDITKGSPFDTGFFNAITPQFKRIAAITGDLVFQAPRRFFLDHLSEKQNAWAYLSKRMKAIPVYGSFHGSDLVNSYGNGELRDYLIRFATNLDPNVGAGKGITWPKYNTTERKLVTFLDEFFPQRITADTYRQESMSLLMSLSLKYPL